MRRYSWFQQRLSFNETGPHWLHRGAPRGRKITHKNMDFEFFIALIWIFFFVEGGAEEFVMMKGTREVLYPGSWFAGLWPIVCFICGQEVMRFGSKNVNFVAD